MPQKPRTSAKYTFSYNKDLRIGDKIILYLPYWHVDGSISSKKLSYCGSTFHIFTNFAHGDRNLTLTLSVVSGKYIAKTTCSILLGKFTNTLNFTNDIKPSPMQSITSKSGGMPPTQYIT